MKHVGQLAGLFSSMLLEGAASPELVQQGYTTEEERSASGLSQVHSAPSSGCAGSVVFCVKPHFVPPDTDRHVLTYLVLKHHVMFRAPGLALQPSNVRL